MSFPVYPKYKDTGTNWLTQVPDEWQLHRLGLYLGERNEKVSDKDFIPLSVTKNGIVPQLETAAKSDDGENRKKVCRNDFVINGRSDRRGSSGLSSYDGSVSLINIVLYPRANIDMRFVHYLLKSTNFQEEFYRYGKGIVADLWSTNFSEMRNILLPMPSLTEQKDIYTFLDFELGKVDALVGEQGRLISLLKEKRHAVICNTLTKGLNPDAPMEDSGVEYLGKLPKHWKFGKCGFYLKILSGFAFPSVGFTQDETDIKLLRGINVGISKLKWDETVFWKRSKDDGLDCYEMREGDIVIGMDRPWISDGVRVAKVESSDLPCLLLQRVASLKAINGLNPDYLMNIISSDVLGIIRLT